MAFGVLDGLLKGSPKDRLSLNRSDADNPILLIVWAYFCDSMAADCFARFEISSASALETNKLRGSSDNSFRRLDMVSGTICNASSSFVTIRFHSGIRNWNSFGRHSI